MGANPTEPIITTLWEALVEYCPNDPIMLLHEDTGSEETLVTGDGNSTSAMIFAVSAAATMALTAAFCAVHRTIKRANAEDQF